MSTELNPRQTLVLWALLGMGGGAAQKDLGFPLAPRDRDALKKAGLVAVEKGARGAIRLEVTDSGWDWASRHLDAALPSGRNATKAGTPILQAWLERLAAYVRVRGVPLAEVLSISAGAGEAAPGSPEAEATEVPYEALRDRVREAYLAATGGRMGSSVPLSRIRAALPEIGRHTLDAVLLRMHAEPGATLMSLANPADIAAERDAAIGVHGREMHILWINR